MTSIVLTPWGKDKIGSLDYQTLEERAAQMGVGVRAGYTVTHRHWTVRVTGHGRSVALTGKGPVTAIIAAALDDFQEALA